MTADTERPTVVVQITIGVPPVAPREDAADAASTTVPRCANCNPTKYKHIDHVHGSNFEGGHCSVGGCRNYTASDVASDGDETAHRIQVLRDDADTLSDIVKRHPMPHTYSAMMLYGAAKQLRAEADRLEGDSA